MSRFQKFLAVVIAMECAALVLAWRMRSHMKLLPPVDWSACLIEDVVAGEIRGMERRLKADDPESWEELAAAYRAFGLFPQAEYCYEQVDKLSPRDRSYLYLWAECFDLMGRTQEASKRYRQIIEERLTVPTGEKTASYCWLNIGQDRLREENVPEAIEALRKAGDIPKAKFLMSRVLIREGRAQEAIVLLDELLSKSPMMVEFNQMKSWAEAELGNEEAAQEFYELSLRSEEELDKTDPVYQRVLKRRKSMGSEVWFDKGIELEKKGSLAQAMKWNRKALRAFWTEDRADRLARLQLQTGHPKEALVTAEDTVRWAGAYASTLDIIGVASVKLGDLDKARRAWKQAADMVSEARYYDKVAAFTDDVQQLRQYQALELYALGKRAWLTNGLTTARSWLEEATAKYDGHAPTWFYLGETRRFLGDPAGAEAAYRRCLQIDPDFGRALRGLERLKQTAGE